MTEMTSTVMLDDDARRITLVGEITRDSASAVIQGLLRLNDQADREGEDVERRLVPIELWIDSPGGFATAAWAIVDVMEIVDADIVTVGVGSVCSAAILPLLFGDARLIMPHAEAMIHGVARELRFEPGNDTAEHHARVRAEMESDIEVMQWANDDLITALVERAGWDPKRAASVVLDGIDHRYLGGRAIVAAGLADAVYPGLIEALEQMAKEEA
jgi:ATP-dependent protease ClpP protease subunit